MSAMPHEKIFALRRSLAMRLEDMGIKNAAAVACWIEYHMAQMDIERAHRIVSGLAGDSLAWVISKTFSDPGIKTAMGTYDSRHRSPSEVKVVEDPIDHEFLDWCRTKYNLKTGSALNVLQP